MADGTQPGQPLKDPAQKMIANIQFMRANGYSPEEIQAEIERWKPKIAAFNAQEMAAARREDAEASAARMGPTATAAKSALEAAQTVAAGFPGAQLGMAALRSATSGISLEEAKRQIQQEVTDVPLASAVGRMAGGLPLAGAGRALSAAAPRAAQALARVPAAARLVGGGAALGATEQFLSGAPGMDMEQRIAQAKQGAVLGAVAAPVAQGLARTGFALWDIVRSAMTPSRAALQMAAEARRAATTKPMFAAAQQAGQTNLPAGLRTGVLLDPDIAPYVQEVASSPSFQTAFPNPTEQDLIKATREYILDAVQKAEQAAVGQAARGTQRVQAGTRMAEADAEELASRLLRASDITTGGKYREAVREYAKQSEAMRAGQEAAEAVRSAGGSKWTPARKLTTQSVEAFARRVPTMSPEQIQAALPMARAGLRESTQLSYSPLAGFGLPRAVQGTFGARRVLEPLELAATGGQAMTPTTLRQYLMGAGIGY